MFVLRRITPSGVQFNDVIGDKYCFISKEISCEQFDAMIKAHDFNDSEGLEYVYGIIYSSYLDDEVIPLYTSDMVYIMNDSGKTFSNITYHSKNNISYDPNKLINEQ